MTLTGHRAQSVLDIAGSVVHLSGIEIRSNHRARAIEAQVVQQMSNGTIKFDIDAGQLISKELQWNESVVGFSGPGSMMTYSARYTESVDATKPTSTASRKVGTVNQRR